MNYRLIKVLVLIVLFAIIAITVHSMANYWLGVVTFPFVSTVAVGTFHLLVLVVLAMAVYHLYKYKA